MRLIIPLIRVEGKAKKRKITPTKIQLARRNRALKILFNSGQLSMKSISKSRPHEISAFTSS